MTWHLRLASTTINNIHSTPWIITPPRWPLKLHRNNSSVYDQISPIGLLHVRFTMENSGMSDECSIKYLDLTPVTVSIRDGMLEWELFVKPIQCHSDVHLWFVCLFAPVVMQTCRGYESVSASGTVFDNHGRQVLRKRSEEKIGELLRLNDYLPEEIERARVGASKKKEKKVDERREWTSVLKLPFVSDVLARDVSRIVRHSMFAKSSHLVRRQKIC